MNCTFRNFIALLFVVSTSISSFSLLIAAVTYNTFAFAEEDKSEVVGPTYSEVNYKLDHIEVTNRLITDSNYGYKQTISYDDCGFDWCAPVQKANYTSRNLNIAALFFFIAIMIIYAVLFFKKEMHLARRVSVLLLLPFALTIAAPTIWFTSGYPKIPNYIIRPENPGCYECTSGYVTVYPSLNPIFLYIAASVQSMFFCCILCFHSCLLSLNPKESGSSHSDNL